MPPGSGDRLGEAVGLWCVCVFAVNASVEQCVSALALEFSIVRPACALQPLLITVALPITNSQG